MQHRSLALAAGGCQSTQTQSETYAALDGTTCSALSKFGNTASYYADVMSIDANGLGIDRGYAPAFADVVDRLAWCDTSYQLVVYDHALAAATTTDIVCEAVAASRHGEILLQEPHIDFNSGYVIYDSLDALLAGEPATQRLENPLLGGGPIAIDDAFVVVAWHSDDRVTVFDRYTDELVSETVLESHDDWFGGIDLVDGDLVLLKEGRSEPAQEIVRYDLMTGAELSRVTTPHEFAVEGLACNKLGAPEIQTNAGEAGEITSDVIKR